MTHMRIVVLGAGEVGFDVAQMLSISTEDAETLYFENKLFKFFGKLSSSRFLVDKLNDILCTLPSFFH